MNWIDLGKFLVVAGTVIVGIGLALVFTGRLPLGRLPGDLAFEGQRFRLYIPVMTCLLLSIVVTLIVNFFWRR